MKKKKDLNILFIGNSHTYEEWEIGVSYVAELYDEVESVLEDRKKQAE